MFPSSITLFYDGASKQNPGPTSGGWTIVDDDGKELAYGFKFVGVHHTNNEGEYHGLIHGLEFIREQGWTEGTLTIKGDSKLVLSQCQGLWNCNIPRLKVLLERARRIIREMVPKIKVKWQHVPRAENVIADGYCNRAIRLQETVSELL